MYWTCGHCCVFGMWVMGSNIVIGLYALHVVSAGCSIRGWWWDII